MRFQYRRSLGIRVAYAEIKLTCWAGTVPADRSCGRPITSAIFLSSGIAATVARGAQDKAPNKTYCRAEASVAGALERF